MRSDRAVRHSEFDIAFDSGDGWHLRGDRPRRLVSANARALLRTMAGREAQPGKCPFCRTAMADCGIPAVDPESYMEGDGDLIGFGLQMCWRCAYWRFWSANYVCMDPSLYAVATSVAGRFSPDLPEGCSVELARALRQCPRRWHAVTPPALERFVADVYRANHALCEVQHVGKTADGGVDVVLITGGGSRTLIQVKRRALDTKHEPVSTIRELLGTLVLENGKTGIVVSTATAFTKPAVQAAADARRWGYVVELVDRGTLDRMVGPLVPRRPWGELFGLPELGVVSGLIQPLVEESFQPDQLALFE